MRQLSDFRVILDGILECTSYQSLDVVKITFAFWFALAEKLKLEENNIFISNFADVFYKLVNITIQHFRYPLESEEWTAQDKEDFRSFRHDIGDCLKYVCSVMGETAPLSITLNSLNECMTKVNEGTVTWQEIEACLFALRAMGATVSPNEHAVLPEIMKGKSPNIPFPVVTLVQLFRAFQVTPRFDMHQFWSLAATRNGHACTPNSFHISFRLLLRA